MGKIHGPQKPSPGCSFVYLQRTFRRKRGFLSLFYPFEAGKWGSRVSKEQTFSAENFFLFVCVHLCRVLSRVPWPAAISSYFFLELLSEVYFHFAGEISAGRFWRWHALPIFWNSSQSFRLIFIRISGVFLVPLFYEFSFCPDIDCPFFILLIVLRLSSFSCLCFTSFHFYV